MLNSNPSFAHIQAEIANILDIPDNQLSEEQSQLINAYMDELAAQESSKVDSFAGFIRKQAAIAEAMKAESDHLKAKAEAINNKIKSLKNHYIAVMRQHGVKKIAGDIYSISVRENTKTEITDFDALMKYDDGAGMYVTTKLLCAPNKDIIKESLKDGVEVPGCKLEKSYSLNIR